MQLVGNDMCFACGKKNPIGLKLEFAAEADEYTSEIEIVEHYQGFAGIVHGGILATALDEIMARLLLDRGYKAITAKLEIRFNKPVKVGEKLWLRARLLKESHRLIETAATACLFDGTPVAEAKSVSMCVNG